MIRSTRIGPSGWVTDLQTLPEDRVLAMGRGNYRDRLGEDAWQTADAEENPVAWLSIHGDKEQLIHKTRFKVPAAMLITAAIFLGLRSVAGGEIPVLPEETEGRINVVTALQAKAMVACDFPPRIRRARQQRQKCGRRAVPAQSLGLAFPVGGRRDDPIARRDAGVFPACRART